jgi:carotenoid 1,2-hydratase
LSADGRHGLTVIAFVGSVFSPYYAFARRRGGDPLNHCAINVALYDEKYKFWAMTERGRDQLHRNATTFTLGRSNLSWDADALTIHIDEVMAPIPSSLRGTVRVYPKALSGQVFSLDAAGRHRWQPIAPCAHVEVLMSQPGLRWHGSGYVDTNTGDEPIENGFRSWNWSRTDLRRGTAVHYDVVSRGGSTGSFAVLFQPNGTMSEFDAPPAAELPPTGWKIARKIRAEDAKTVRVVKTLESAPFYARTLVSTQALGERAFAIHESLSLDRFSSPWVQAMLPFRMPRRAR